MKPTTLLICLLLLCTAAPALAHEHWLEHMEAVTGTGAQRAAGKAREGGADWRSF